MKNIAASLYSSSIPVILIVWGIAVFVCLGKSMPISLKWFWWNE